MTTATLTDQSLRRNGTGVSMQPAAPITERTFGVRSVDAPRAFRNLRMIRLLSRIGHAFNEAGVEVLLLKGAALNLTLYARPDERTMDDLDLLVRPGDIDAACAALEGLGGLRGKSQVREDFFPKYHYEIEYTLGRIYPVKIDLHVRPFRPLRYSQTVPDEALWADAEVLDVGGAKMLHPAADDMLIHLATHCAIHGNGRDSWLTDIARWIERFRSKIDWDRFVKKASSWRLVYAIRFALDAVEEKFGVAIPANVKDAMGHQRVTWRDRLTVEQAPFDASHPTRHVLVSAISTPNWTFVASYLWGMAIPDRAHMADWYCGRHFGWLPAAHLLRLCGPVLSKLPKLTNRFSRIEVRESKVHGIGVFARRKFGGGEVIARFAGRRTDRKGMYVVPQVDAQGDSVRVELSGDVRFLNHSCSANAKLERFALVAVKPIPAGKEITIDYGPVGCSCRDRKATESGGAEAVETGV
jgi:Uncharacterised nucleotidyltransferase/SET domain